MGQQSKGIRKQKYEMDTRFVEMYNDLKKKHRIRNLIEFARKLGVSHGNNLYGIFRAAEGDSEKVRHVNDYLITKLNLVFNVNENYIRKGELPRYNSPNDKLREELQIEDDNLSDIAFAKIIGNQYSRGFRKSGTEINLPIILKFQWDDLNELKDIVKNAVIEVIGKKEIEETEHWITSEEARRIVGILSVSNFHKFIKRHGVRASKISHRTILVEKNSLMSAIRKNEI